MAERKPFLLRVDPQVLEALQGWAADELRSLNGQIEFLLRRALRDAAACPDPAAGPGRKDGLSGAPTGRPYDRPSPASARRTHVTRCRRHGSTADLSPGGRRRQDPCRAAVRAVRQRGISRRR